MEGMLLTCICRMWLLYEQCQLLELYSIIVCCGSPEMTELIFVCCNFHLFFLLTQLMMKIPIALRLLFQVSPDAPDFLTLLSLGTGASKIERGVRGMG